MAQVARRVLFAGGVAIALAAVYVAASVSEPQARAVAGLEPAPVRAPASPPLRRAPELDLVGVVEAGGVSTAIIAGRDGAQKAYGVGDEVRPGLTLEKIARDSVVLLAGDERYRLPLTRKTAAGPAPAAADRAVAVEAKPDDGFASWQRRNSDPGMPQQGRLTPEPGGGMRMEDVKPGSPYAKMGFRAGDVLLSVNQVPLESPEQLMRLFRSQRFGSQQVEVLRDGRLETLRFSPG